MEKKEHHNQPIKSIFPVLVSICILFGCSDGKREEQESTTEPERKEVIHHPDYRTLDFLGDTLQSSLYLHEDRNIERQIYSICHCNPRFHFTKTDEGNHTIKIAGSKFLIAVEHNDIELISKKSPESEAIHKVIELLCKTYGKPQVNGPDIMLWYKWERTGRSHYIRLLKDPAADGGTLIEFISHPETDYINSVCGHNEKDTIRGKFMKGKTVSLWFERCHSDNYEVWQLCCSDRRIKPVKFWAVSPRLVDEGDLDGDGINDFGFVDTWHTSNCRNYNVLTIKEGKIKYMLQLETALSLRASGKNLVSATGKKGRVHAIYSDMEGQGACCNWAPEKDTVLSVHYSDPDQSAFQ